MRPLKIMGKLYEQNPKSVTWLWQIIQPRCVVQSPPNQSGTQMSLLLDQVSMTAIIFG